MFKLLFGIKEETMMEECYIKRSTCHCRALAACNPATNIGDEWCELYDSVDGHFCVERRTGCCPGN